MSVQHHTLQRDGLRWHVVTSGPSDGQPVLLLHCWSGNWHLWEKTLTYFGERYRFIVPDHLGFGESDKPLGDYYRIDQQAERAHFILQQFGYESAFVVGHSMGGQIALTLAGMYPENVSRLIVVDPAVTGKLHPLAQLGTPLLTLARYGIHWPLVLLVKAGRMYPPAGLQFIRTYFPHPLAHREAALYWAGQMVAEGQIYSNGWAAYAVWQWDVTPLLSKITAPTLAIWGKKDWNVPMSESHVLEQHIRDFRLSLIPEVGHFPMIEAWETFIHELEQFLQLPEQ